MSDEDPASRLTWHLAALGATGVFAGSGLALLARRSAVRAFGRQTLAWGAVDLAIAGVALLRPAGDPVRLRRILLLNAGLDLGYVAAGAHVAYHRTSLGGRWSPEESLGHGSAVAVQGLALFALDMGHYRRLRTAG